MSHYASGRGRSDLRVCEVVRTVAQFAGGNSSGGLGGDGSGGSGLRLVRGFWIVAEVGQWFWTGCASIGTT